MWSAQRIDARNFLLSHHAKLYLMSIFESLDGYQLCIASVSSLKKKHFFPAGYEVFATYFWAADPESLIPELLQEISQLPDLDYPVELVYKFGGTVRSTQVRIPKISEVH